MSSNASLLVEILAVIAFSTLFSLGGGNGQLAIIQDHWVDPGILSPALFAWAYAIGNLCPRTKVQLRCWYWLLLGGIPRCVSLLGGHLHTDRRRSVFGVALARSSEAVRCPVHSRIWVRDRGDDADCWDGSRAKHHDRSG